MSDSSVTTLAIWSLVVLGVGWIIVRLPIAPRSRSALILAAFLATFAPFFAFSRFTPAPTTQPIAQSSKNVQSAGAVNTNSSGSPEMGLPGSNRFIAEVWLLGAGVSFGLLVMGVLRMNSFARRGHVTAPMVAGFPRTRLLLPEDWPADLTPEEAAAAIAHEEAHLRGKHVPIRVLAGVLQSALWWNPFAHLLVRDLELSFEAIADGVALDSCEARDLASAILKVAEAGHKPRLAAAVVRRGADLENRMKNIMKHRGPGRLVAAATLVLAGLTAALALAPALRISLADPEFGLKKGAQWTYEIRFGEQASDYILTVDKVISEKDQKVFEMIASSSTGSRNHFRYQALRKAGLFDLHNTQMTGRGYEPRGGNPVVLKPFAKGSSWKWTSPFRGQVAAGPNGEGPNLKDLELTCTAMIEIEDESVTVPAGTFKCYRVFVTQTSKANGKSTFTDWISPEVGLVRRHIPARENQEGGSWELKKFSPGS